ncbi:MAG: hypothetical protein K2W95_10285 [Candidatus Obscuribacterales bacterium]|nr:hypothetical protein [Candidatus Obscuribacterales bacterium]
MRLTTTVFVRTSLAVAALLVLASPAMAQNALNSKAATGDQTNNTNNFTGAQAMQGGTTESPRLQGATNGTVGPQGGDATVIQGVNTAGTVRVNNLANLEALCNIIANGMEILGIAWGGPTIIMGFMHMSAGTQDAMKRIIWGMSGVTGGMATPGCINWLVASARDANLFS